MSEILNENKEIKMKTKKPRQKFFATKAWYGAAIALISWAIFQEIIMASTDIVDNIFVNILREDQVDGLTDLLNEIKASGWQTVVGADLLPEELSEYALGGLKYSAGQIAINGVAASNQLYIIMFAMISGFCYGAGVFSSQYFGAKDHEKLRQVTAIKLYVTISIAIIFVFLSLPKVTEVFIGFTTHPVEVEIPKTPLTANSSKEEVLKYFRYFQFRAATLSTEQGANYFRVISWSYIIFAFNETMITSLRETRRPIYSFFMALVSLATNCVLNVFLTSPTFIANFSGLGVIGCAIATGSSRVLQLIFIITLLSIKRFEFFPHPHNFRIQKEVAKKVLLKSTVVLFNETLYGLGVVVQVKLKALYSVEALTGNAMYETVLMALLSPLYHGINAGISVMVGNELGASNFDKAKYNATHLMKMSFLIGIIFGALLAGSSFAIPNLLFSNSNAEAKRIGTWMMFYFGVVYPFVILNNGSYSILRAGGQTISSFLMDSAFNWLIQIPLIATLIFINARTSFKIDIIWIHLAACLVEVLKLGVSMPFYFRRKWLQNLTLDTDKDLKKLAKKLAKEENKKTEQNTKVENS